MTERKPPGAGWNGFIEQQIQDAARRGEFDGLPGLGKPIPGLDEPHDPLWWCKQKLEREGLSFTPETIRVRKSLEEFLERLPLLPTEAHVRQRVAELNERILEANRTQVLGPGSDLGGIDADAVVARWRRARGL